MTVNARLEINLESDYLQFTSSRADGSVKVPLSVLPNQPNPANPTRFRADLIQRGEDEYDIFDLLTNIDGSLQINF